MNMDDAQINQDRIPRDDQQSDSEESPAEKLGKEPTTGPIVPGVENPESEEIKDETRPNTE